MSDQPHAEVEILNAALDLPAAERAAYLDQACAGSPAMRQHVEELIRSHLLAENFLVAPPGGLDFNRTLSMTVPVTEKPGDKIGHYKLLQQIGEGGCGVVYMAEQDEPVRRRVALKVIKLGMDTRSVIARFEAERQALALMDHPNIARVLDAGATETGRPYFVMELVRGIRITDYCDESRLSTEDRLKLFIQVCHAIQHAHQKGIIHRDIKPSNILVTVNDGVPVPKVIDFGIAKATQGRLTDKTLFTAFEQFIGTPAYMSPEQAVMTSLDIDTRSDIYSLGVLLYELLTGKTPFDAEELLRAGLDAMRRTIREQEPLKPSTRLSTMLEGDRKKAASHRQTDSPKLIHLVRGDLDWIVMKSLEKERARRYETANGLAFDVRRHLSNEPIGARPPSLAYQFQKLARRKRGLLAAASALIVVVLLALTILAVSNVRIARERNQKAVALVAARTGEEHAREQLFHALQNQAQARRFSGRIGQRTASLAALTEAARIRSEAGLRDDATAAMALPDILPGPVWQGYPTGSMAVSFDQFYRHYARLEEAGWISIRNIPEDREIQRIPFVPVRPESFTGLEFSPDTRFLATIDPDQQLRVWQVADGKLLPTEAPKGCSAWAFSHDNQLLAMGLQSPTQDGNSNDWSIALLNLVSGRETRRWKTQGQIHSLAFSPDNSKLAVGYLSAAMVSVYDAQQGAVLAELPIGPNRREVIAWHPDGKRLAIAGSGARIQIWNVESEHRLLTLEGHDPVVTVLNFHPDGAMLASYGWDSVARLWDSSSGKLMMQTAMIGTIKFGGDGRRLGAVLSPGGGLQLLEVMPSREYQTFGGSGGSYLEGEISPDGRLLTLGCSDGVRLWELSTGLELAFLPIGFTCSSFFSSTGDTLFTCGPSSGLQRWPLHRADPENAFLQLRPPIPIKLPFPPTRACRSRDDQTIAVVCEGAGKAMVLDLASGSVKGQMLPHTNGCYVALSPNGQWLATSGWHSSVTRLWKVETGELMHEWECGGSMVAFTPDSRNLVISEGAGFSFWDVTSLQIVRRLPCAITTDPSHVAFSSDGKLMARRLSSFAVDLVEVATGRSVAHLESPPDEGSTPIAFNPAGTELVELQSHVIHSWNLAAIRARLKAMGLDWDWPEFAPATALIAPPNSSANSRLKVEVIRSNNR